MSALQGRRGFLSGLIGLPLIGGGVTLIGKPTAAAVPVTMNLLEGYKTWLDQENRFLTWEMADMPIVARRMPTVFADNDRTRRWKAIGGYLDFVGDCAHAPWDSSPSARAATILAAAGVDWREDER